MVEDTPPLRTGKDGTTWRIGTQSDVAWIKDQTETGMAITSAIPPIFDAYVTIVIPNDDHERQLRDQKILALLTEQSADQPWWLGYLDTGSADIVFADAPKIGLHAGWSYVLVEAGPEQAATWRHDDPWHGALPSLVFPADRSWLMSTLWDDDWRCLGGTGQLVERVLAAEPLQARAVSIEDADATPPGHSAR